MEKLYYLDVGNAFMSIESNGESFIPGALFGCQNPKAQPSRFFATAKGHDLVCLQCSSCSTLSASIFELGTSYPASI